MRPPSYCWYWSGSRSRGCWFAPLPPANSRARCSWSVSPRCLAGRSAVLSDATGRGPTRLTVCRKRCCRNHRQRNVTSRAGRRAASWRRLLRCNARRTVANRSNRLPDEAEIAEINARHLIATPIKPADLLFVFGTREDVERRVDEAFRLWREGFFQWSIVSGGVTPGATLSECEIIKAAMLGRGIPADRILEEQ